MGGCVLFVRDSFSVWMKDESSDESSEFLLCLISLFRHLKAISLRQRLAKQRLNSSHHLTYSLSSCSLNSNPPSRQIPRLYFIKEAEECLLVFLFQKTIFELLLQPIRKK